MTTVDFGRRSQDYAQHRPGFPPSFYDRMEGFCSLANVTALDIATGPGVVALRLAERGAQVTGIDIASGQIEAAIEKAEQMGLAQRTTFNVCRDTEFKAPPSSFDLITACQCWRWLNHEGLFPHVRQMLKPGGLFVVAHFDYIAHRSEIARRTEDLILKFNPAWTLAGKSGLYPDYIDQLIEGGFEFIEQFCYDHLQEFTRESWRGRIRTCNGVGSGGMTPDTLHGFDLALDDMLKRAYPDEPLKIWHRVWAVITRTPRNSRSSQNSPHTPEQT